MTQLSPTTRNSSHDAAIDAALRAITHAEPRPGLPGRVLAHLESQPVEAPSRWWRIPFLPRYAINGVGAVLVAGAVLYGTIEHSHKQGFHPQVRIAPVDDGFRDANTSRQPSAPLTTVPTLHGRPGRPTAKRGRANVPLQARKPNGVGVPKSPMVPSPQGDTNDPQ